MTTVTELFGARLRRARAAKGWSLREFAAKSGLSSNTILRAEHGHGLGLAGAAVLAETIGISLAALTEPSTCRTCDGFPLPGFTCNDCGNRNEMTP
jgi:transcriptional regulator with XRE-family HTH domain